MSAEYSTEMKISATKKELKELLHFLRGYEDGFKYENGYEVSFESMDISSAESDELNLYDMDDDEINAFIETMEGNLCINAMGPYGYFDIEELPVFLDIAHNVPNAKISVMVQGFDIAGDHRAWCETKDGKVYIYYKFTDYDADDEEYEDLETYDSKAIYDSVTKKRLRK